MINRTTLADALHQTGRLVESEATFQEAEKIQKNDQPRFPLLYSVQGYQYCDLLLGQGETQEVRHRASHTLEWYGQASGSSLLDIALDNLSLGHAHLLQSQREPNHPITESASYLNRAVDGLRQAGTQHHLPRGLLARAEFYRVTGALDKAQRDLDEALTIATRGGMGLHLADCHLEYARLYLAQHNLAKVGNLRKVEEAREHWKIAKEMIEKMGYHRRDKEVEELEGQL